MEHFTAESSFCEDEGERGVFPASARQTGVGGAQKMGGKIALPGTLLGQLRYYEVLCLLYLTGAEEFLRWTCHATSILNL